MKIRVISKWQALVNQRQKLQFCFFKRYTCLWGSPVCAVQQNWKERTKSHSMMTNYLELYYKVNKNSQNSIKELNDFQGMLRKISYTYLFTRDKKMHIWKYVHTSYFRSASISKSETKLLTCSLTKTNLYRHVQRSRFIYGL